MTCDAFACGVEGVLTGIVGRTQGLQACTSFTKKSCIWGQKTSGTSGIRATRKVAVL